MKLRDTFAAFSELLGVCDSGEYVEARDFVELVRELLTIVEAPPGEGDPDPATTDGLATILLRCLQEYGDAPVALAPVAYAHTAGYHEADYVVRVPAHPTRDGEAHFPYDGEWQVGSGDADDDTTILVIGR